MWEPLKILALHNLKPFFHKNLDTNTIKIDVD